jgi:NADH-quinone oxidoreductase subunit H
VHVWPGANEGYWPLLWFFGKVLFFIFIFIWLRGSLPRLRYDQFMAFGWKRLIPISLVWIIAVATIRTVSLEGGIDRQFLLIAIGVLAVLFLALFFVGGAEESDEAGAATARTAGATTGAGADGSAASGGFPVPPMPTGGAVRGAARPLTFEQPSIRQSPTTSNAAPAREEI